MSYGNSHTNTHSLSPFCPSINVNLPNPSVRSFVTSNILTDINYSSKGVYWLGGEVNTKTGRYEWSDGSQMNFQV